MADRQSEPDAHIADRPTPNAEVDPDYRAFIAATEGAAFQTQRIRAEDLAALRKASRSSASKLTPLAALAPPAPAAPAGPTPLPSSFRPTSAPVPTRRRTVAWPLVLFVVAAAGGGVWGWKHRAQVVAAARAVMHTVARAEAVPAATASPAPTIPTATSATSATTDAPAAPSSVPAATASSEPEARRALERFRAGFAACVRGIRGLPGSSPIVPAPLATLGEGPVAAPPPAWKTAVWSCAHFQIDEPMRYALQWQLVRPGVEGMAVVWYDVGADGVARGALGFSAKMGAYGPPQVGEIVPLPASRPAVVVR